MTPTLEPGRESAFLRGEYAARVDRARRASQAAGIDVMVVTSPENIFYLTGQQTLGYFALQALVLPVEGEPVFVLRQLETTNFVANSFVADLAAYQDTDDPVDVLARVLRSRGGDRRRVAIDKGGWFFPVAAHERLQAALGPIADAAGIVEALRAVKSPREIEKIALAAGYVDAGMTAGLAAVRAGASENDVVAAMVAASIAAGSEYVGMEPILSSGPRSGVPHGTWRRRRIEAGDPVLMEMAGCHDRYHAVLARTAWVGAMPDAAAAMMAVCQDALRAALDAVRPGEPCAAPHAACQSIVDRAGYTDAFRKRAGYSMGIAFAPDWGEGGILSLNAGVGRLLEPGMVFHVFPALRIYGVFTVGVSETIVVTESGCRVLGTVDRDLRRVAA